MPHSSGKKSYTPAEKAAIRKEYEGHVKEAEARAARIAKKEAPPRGANTSGLQMRVRQQAEKMPEGNVRRRRR